MDAGESIDNDGDSIALFASTGSKRKRDLVTDHARISKRHQDDTLAPTDCSEGQNFRSLGLSKWLDSVCKSLGIVQPTPVQTGCIPAILQVYFRH